ncbi:NAC transcription factor 29-like [Pyrus communis]|uniref:NAC transcription factor 29-like n=1 Tax=Pyrus communis TaxID=23211 RepID=UPI0035C124C5
MSSSMASSASQSADENEGFDLLKCSTVQEGKKDAEIRLPLGYRFDPTGDEILVYYLFNKIMDRAMPTYDLIKEVDVYECDPNQLPNGDFRHTADFNAAYYFANREPFDACEGKIIKTATNGGYWKVIDDEEEVLFEDSNVIVGFETVMKFYKGQAPNGTKTPFVMNEYRLNPRVVPAHVLNESIKNKIEKYVVCQIINKEVSNQPAIEYGQGLLELLQKSSAGTVEDGVPK